MSRLVAAVALALPLWALAQSPQGPTGILLESALAVVNEPVKVVIDFAAAQRWCGLRVDFGDGGVSDLLVEDFPLTLTKRYAAPGRYVLRAEGRLVMRGMATSPGCAGARRSVVITVAESSRDPQSSRPRPGDRRGGGQRDAGTIDYEEWRQDRQGVDLRADREVRAEREDRPEGPERAERPDRPERVERDDRPDRANRERSAQEQRPEREPPGGRGREAAPPPVRTTNPPAEAMVVKPKVAAQPARPPAPRRKPPRDDSLQVF